jgi:hypothetical protein
MKPNPGVRRLHSTGCPAKTDDAARCRCNAGYEASVYDKSAGRKIRKTFPTAAAARTWRSDAAHGVRRGTVRAVEPTTVNEAADTLIAEMENGSIRTRSGDPYKPSAIRAYREVLDLHVLRRRMGSSCDTTAARALRRRLPGGSAVAGGAAAAVLVDEAVRVARRVPAL